MLESLFVKDFQAHSKIKIDFDDITVIVGPSDSGKSSILRALLWVLTNSPAGDSFIRDGADNAAVKLVVDGQEVLRRRGKSGNTYQLNGDEFKAFRNGVPDEITQLLKVSDVNVQSQHDSPYWLSLSDGEVSRRLNEVVDLSLVDRCLAVSKANVADCKKRREILHESIQTLTADVEQLEWVDEAMSQSEAIDAMRSETAKSSNELETLKAKINSYYMLLRVVQENEERLGGVKTLGKAVADLRAEQSVFDGLELKVLALSTLLQQTAEDPVLEFDVDSVKSLESRTKQLDYDLTTFSNLYLPESEPAMDFDVGEVQELEKTLMRLSDLINQSHTTQNTLNATLHELTDVDTELKSFDTCPLCGAST